jgi:serine/threonine-protein kinase RsbW
VEYSVNDERVRVAVEDHGPGFSPDTVPDPTLDENLEAPSGRGLVLMRAYMTRIWHNETGNRVEMELRRPEDIEGMDSADRSR